MSGSTVWGLIDDRTGHTGQVLGVIAKLGVPYALKRLEYNLLGRLPCALIGNSLLGLDRARSAPILPPWPSLVIAAGRRTVPVLRFIKKQSPDTATIYLMWPENGQHIDLIAVPEHDEAPDRPNVIRTLAPLHAVTPETLHAAKAAWGPQFQHLPRPWVTLILGGDTKHGSYAPADWRNVIERAQRLAGNGSLLITTSRRTPAAALNFCASVTSPHILHRWDKGMDNPYLGMLACADAIVVTGDSLSMCAEACVSGKPVYIFAPPKVIPEKHARLHRTLYAKNMARPLDDTATLDWAPIAPLDDAGYVAAEIRGRFPLAFAA